MRPDDKELVQLLNEKFIPVRLVNMKGVDLNYFQFDYDLTFAVLMMNANGYVYSRFGTMDATQTTHRMSIAGLKNAMRKTLVITKLDLPVPEAKPRSTLTDIPAFAKSRPANEACYHCHFVGAFRFKQMRADGKFAQQMVFQHPFPENIGMTLDVDHGNIVQSVAADSPAQRAGVKVGDIVVGARAAGQKALTPITSSADLQFVLNAVPDPGEVYLHLFRLEQPVTLKLPKGWRKTDVSWRSSQATFPPTVGIWGEALTDEQKTQRGLTPGKLALKVTFFFNGPEWAASRGELKLNDIIYGLDGEQPASMTIRQFHSHFRLTYNVGDTVTLNVLRGDQKLDLKVPCTSAGEG